MSKVEMISKVRALNSPLRLEILTYLRTHGASTAAEIAAWLGQKEQRLYYHLGRLVRAELVRVDGVKPGATKPESVYVAGEMLSVEGVDYKDQRCRREIARNVAHVLRTAANEYELALEILKEQTEKTCSLFRVTARLTQAEREELTLELQRLADWLKSKRSSEGSRYGVTLVVSNLLPKKER